MNCPRLLVAFEGPAPEDALDPIAHSGAYETAWDLWVESLRTQHLMLVSDLDPVATVGTIEVYEAVPA